MKGVQNVQKYYDEQSIMVWGAVSTKGVLSLKLCEKNMDSTEYMKIVGKELFIDFCKAYGGIGSSWYKIMPLVINRTELWHILRKLGGMC